jgi:hypothetical protein
MHMNGYTRFGAMIATSTLVMFGLMYLNTYQMDHVFFSETRAYMALVMGATMAVVMLSFMWSMYKDRRVNLGIIGGSVIVFAAALWLVRSQATVDDVSYMRAMIPHHSIAILTSERARITDPRVRELADAIIEAQRREIDEMKGLDRGYRSALNSEWASVFDSTRRGHGWWAASMEFHRPAGLGTAMTCSAPRHQRRACRVLAGSNPTLSANLLA